MARLIPKIEPSEIHNSSERKVAEALVRQLPDSNIVIHSFNWTARLRRGAIAEGECDFILLDPRYGMLFIEVKGGIIKYLPDDGTWIRTLSRSDAVPKIKDPIGQVSRNMHNIVDYAKKNLGRDQFPCPFGFAVAFPDGRFQGPHPASAQREQIFDASSLDQLETAVRRIFGMIPRKQGSPMDKSELEQLKRALLPKYEIVPVYCRDIKHQEAMLHRATEDQKGILELLDRQNFAAVEGGAGTGKTLLAIAKAQSLAASGLRTLLVCYNRALSNWLVQLLTDEFGNSLSIQTYHNLVMECCERANIKPIAADRSPTQKFWDEIAPERLMDACELLPCEQKFDAVIVDEGQDFKGLWWDSLESVFRDPNHKSCYYVFYDPRQNLYVKDSVELPSELGKPYPLTTNCRNTVEIAQHCASIIGEQIKTRPNSPAGISPQIFTESNWRAGFRKAEQLTRELCLPGHHALEMSQVVVLTPGYAKSNWPNKFKGFNLTRDIDQWRANDGILIASLHQFKGLEADAVILLTPPLPKTDSKYHIENYVACSRAKHVLHIVHVEQSNSAN